MATLTKSPPKSARKLYPTRNDLRESTRSQVAALLNRRLSDAIDLQTQCKQAHWNVKGPSFIALHKLFDDVYAAVDEYVDLLAERIVQLGGIAEGTARTVAERSELDEYPLDIATGEDHVKALSAAMAAFGSRIRFAINETDELEDADSTDICTEISRGVDKWLWFVEAHGQARA
jgi:starvation-inducible DNA-binding protein